MTKRKAPTKTKDLPVTHEMLFAVRDELKELIKVESKKNDARFKDIDAKFDHIDARFDNIDAKFKNVDAKFKSIDAQFKNIDARFDRVDSNIAEIKSMFHQSMLRFEEQRSENKVVLEALQGLAHRQNRLESEFVQVNETVRSLAKAKSTKGRA